LKKACVTPPPPPDYRGMITTERKLSLTSHFFGTFEGIDSNFVKNNPSYWKTSGIQANFSCRVTDAA